MTSYAYLQSGSLALNGTPTQITIPAGIQVEQIQASSGSAWNYRRAAADAAVAVAAGVIVTLPYEVRTDAPAAPFLVDGAGTLSFSLFGAYVPQTPPAVRIGIPPINTVLPAVTGTVDVGQTLTSTSGTWKGTGNAYAYQWYRDNQILVGATAATHVIATADIGTTLTCKVTATNSVGSATATSNAIRPAVPANIVAPAITGSSAVGGVLTCGNGTWNGSATIVYTRQWQRDGVDIGGETATTYTVLDADNGKTISCNVTGTNALGASTAASNSIAVSNAPANTVAPVASGLTVQGSTLSCTTGTWTGLTPITYTYQWRRAGVAIVGATNSTYVTQAADIGAAVDCLVTATNSVGPTSVDSNNITVTPIPPVNTVAPVVSGLTPVGSTLTTTNGTWTGTPTIAFTYQWQNAGVDIVGETASTYVTQAGDAGDAVRCVVTGTNAAAAVAANSNAITVDP